MGLLGSVLLGAVVSYGGAAPATEKFPAYTVQVEETRSTAQCLGVGFDQNVTINLENYSIARIAVKNRCANENTLDELDIITIYRPANFGEEMSVCSSCDDEEFVRALLPQAVRTAWENSRKAYAQELFKSIERMVRSGDSINDKTRGLRDKMMGVFSADDNGVEKDGKVQSTVRMGYNPGNDDDIYFSAAKQVIDGKERSALVLYRMNRRESADAKGRKKMEYTVTVHYDIDANGTLNKVLVLPAQVIDGIWYIDKSLKEHAKGAYPESNPTPEQIEFFDSYFKGLVLKRVNNSMSVPIRMQKRVPVPMEGTERRR